jgi:hypothetical protein
MFGLDCLLLEIAESRLIWYLIYIDVEGMYKYFYRHEIYEHLLKEKIFNYLSGINVKFEAMTG